MLTDFNYFKKERNILSIVIDLDDKVLSSSDKSIIFIQARIKAVYHDVIDKALYNNILYGTNLAIFYTLDNINYNVLTCQYYNLTKYSKDNLLLEYDKLLKFRNITLYIGLSP
jgi:hypothetical protein